MRRSVTRSPLRIPSTRGRTRSSDLQITRICRRTLRWRWRRRSAPPRGRSPRRSPPTSPARRSSAPPRFPAPGSSTSPSPTRRCGTRCARGSPRRGSAFPRRRPGCGPSSITPHPTSPKKCTSATCGPPSSPTRCRASSSIGEALVRICWCLGSEVVKQNHLGDWATQFGMLIQYIDEHPEANWRASELSEESPVAGLDNLYKAARGEFDSDPEFAVRARRRVVALQAGDEATLAVWREIVAESERFFGQVYSRLGLLLTPADAAGESFYNPMLPGVTEELETRGLAQESEGALVILSEETRGQDDQPAALIVRKSDGGYGYDTTDLATLRYRIHTLDADRILYVVGAPQALHFKLIFEAGRRAGWLTDDVHAQHVQFGSVLGADGKPFKTREGVS